MKQAALKGPTCAAAVSPCTGSVRDTVFTFDLIMDDYVTPVNHQLMKAIHQISEARNGNQ